nr:OmpA family protein [Saprospiraceae bacterium]
EQVVVKEASTRIEKRAMEHETMTEQIEVSPATQKWEKKKADKNCLSANPDDCLVWCLVEVPARYNTVTKRIKKGCAEGWTEIGDDCVRTVDVPVEYGTRTYKKLVSDATTESNKVDAAYGTRTYRKLVSDATTTSTEVPAQYATRTYKTLLVPAGTYSVSVDAEYGTRTYQKLVSGPTSTVVKVDPVYETRSYQVVKTPASVEEIEVPAKYDKRTWTKLVQNATTEEVKCGAKVTLDNINFKTASAELLSSSYTEINRLKDLLIAEPNVTAKLVGHTDSDGSEESNLVLSRNRAKAVYDALVDAGISASRLSYEGKGESEPVASNATAEGKRQNRRTEFITYGSTGTGDCNEYGNRIWSRLINDASASYTDVAAQYGNITYQKVVNDATTNSTDVPAEYGNRTWQKLVADATTTSTDVPVEYTTRSYQKLASAATTRSIDVPAETKTISKRVLEKAGGFTEWREVVCETDITAELVRRVQTELKDRGYDPGPIDNVMGAGTKAALSKFQKDNNLPIGQLNIETLKALGIK